MSYSASLNIESHCSSVVKQKYIIIFFFTFLSLTLSVSHWLSLSQRARPSQSSLFLSSHISFSHSRLALELSLVRGHGMEIGVDFGFWILDRRRSTEIGDCGGLCLDRWAVWIVGQVVGLELWVKWWVWIGGSVYHGSGGGVGLDPWRLVGYQCHWWSVAQDCRW